MKELIEEAKNCTNCLDWHKHCNAECCSLVYIYVHPSALSKQGKNMVINRLLPKDLVWYYKLRGIVYAHGLVQIEKKYCIPDGDKIMYTKPCSLLEDNKCKGHPVNKPLFCQALTKESSKTPGAIITPNCLFKYQLLEE